MDLYNQVPLLPLGTPSIRLLEPYLVQQNEDGVSHGHVRIHGRLTTHPLGETPAYQVLSYTWGDQTEKQVATFNGSKCFISSNVHDALSCLLPKVEGGSDTRRMRIWIDGVSINQYNNAEKSSQVSKMREIYAQVERCLAWLGKAHGTTQLAFDTLERFARNDGRPDGSNTFAELAKDMNERAAAIEEILLRPWFTRIWVLQEIVGAIKVIVHCGPHEIEWHQLTSSLKKAVGSGFLKFPISHPLIARVIKMADWRWAFHQKCEDARERDAALDLKVIIMDGGDKNATDMRDKVFALRGIASATFSDGIIVRYEKPVEEIYIDCAKFLLRTRTELRLLSLVRQGQKKKSGLSLPSWVPDWSQGMDGGGVLQRYFRFKAEKYFRAALATAPKLRLPADSNTVILSGHCIGAVKIARGINGLLKDLEYGTVSISKST